MSNMFSGQKVAGTSTIEEDFVGGNGPVETDIYNVEIKSAYIVKSGSAGSKSQSMNLILKSGKTEIRGQIWMTNRNGESTYKDKKTKKEVNLPGWNQVSSLCLLTLGKEIAEMEVEDKTLNLYDFELKKEIPKSVPCFVELHGETINVAVQKQTVDVTKKNDDTNEYEATGKTRDVNELVKFFDGEKCITISEVKQFVESLGGTMDSVIEDGEVITAIKNMKEEQGVYANIWLTKNKDQTWDRSSGKKAEGKPFNRGSENSGEKAAEAKKNLFGN